MAGYPSEAYFNASRAEGFCFVKNRIVRFPRLSQHNDSRRFLFPRL
jgi:hypothetical protein